MRNRLAGEELENVASVVFSCMVDGQAASSLNVRRVQKNDEGGPETAKTGPKASTDHRPCTAPASHSATMGKYAVHWKGLHAASNLANSSQHSQSGHPRLKQLHDQEQKAKEREVQSFYWMT